MIETRKINDQCGLIRLVCFEGRTELVELKHNYLYCSRLLSMVDG